MKTRAAVAWKAGAPLTIETVDLQDHGCHFIATLIEDHLRDHARALCGQ